MAKEELNAIASSPSAKHVFRVENFGALDAIRETLQDSIFAIEGTDGNLASWHVLFFFLPLHERAAICPPDAAMLMSFRQALKRAVRPSEWRWLSWD